MKKPAAKSKDSGSLTAETFRALSESAEGLTAADIAGRVLRIKNVPPELAARLVANMLSKDQRFEPGPDGKWRAKSAPPVMLDEIEFAVVDVETTGGTGKYNRLTEIGAFRMTGGRIGQSWMTLINPGREIPLQISQLTGIYDETVADAPRAALVLPGFLKFLGGAVFVGHNVMYDYRTINGELARASLARMKNPTLCTMMLSRRVWPGMKSYGLDALIARFSLDLGGERHRGHGDAWATAVVFAKLLEELAPAGITTLDEILAFQKNPIKRKKKTATPPACPEKSTSENQ